VTQPRTYTVVQSAAATRDPERVGQGGTWADALTALPWGSGEVLAVGTSSSAISRFFLGSHASKIVRNSPVPVYLWYRAVPGQ
jgi:nucleotide-binding universal stress UspA family protein